MSDEKQPLLVVELVKVERSGARTIDQYIGRNWLVDASEPIRQLGVGVSLERTLASAGALLVSSEAEVGEKWSAPLPDRFWEVLELSGMISSLDGIAVLEVVLHTSSGPVYINRPRRFLVVMRGMSNAIYSCDSVDVAYGVAELLARNQAVTVQGVEEIPKPVVKPRPVK